MPARLMNCTLPKLMAKKGAYASSITDAVQMPPQRTFHSDKFLIYFQMAFEFLEHLLRAIIFPFDTLVI